MFRSLLVCICSLALCYEVKAEELPSLQAPQQVTSEATTKVSPNNQNSTQKPQTQNTQDTPSQTTPKNDPSLEKAPKKQPIAKSSKPKKNKSNTKPPNCKNNAKEITPTKEETIKKATKDILAASTVYKGATANYLPTVSDEEVNFIPLFAQKMPVTQNSRNLLLTLVSWLVALLSLVFILILILYNFKIPLRYEPHTLKKLPHKKYTNLKK